MLVPWPVIAGAGVLIMILAVIAIVSTFAWFGIAQQHEELLAREGHVDRRLRREDVDAADREQKPMMPLRKMPDGFATWAAIENNTQLRHRFRASPTAIIRFRQECGVPTPGRAYRPRVSGPGSLDAIAGQSRAIQAADRLRADFLDPQLFVDSRWRIMLALALARAERRQLLTKALARADGVAETTGLRVIADLEARGFVDRRKVKRDRRRIVVALTDRGWTAMLEWLAYHDQAVVTLADETERKTARNAAIDAAEAHVRIARRLLDQVPG